MGSSARVKTAPAIRPVRRGLCVLMVCTDMSEADQVGRALSEVNSGCLVTYRRAEDLMSNAPAGEVALVILANESTPVRLDRTLRWLRRRWPRCPLAVVGDQGGGEREIAARSSGAMYLTRPVAAEEWSALLEPILPSRVYARVSRYSAQPSGGGRGVR